MARCCGGGSQVKIEEGRHVEVLGTGTPSDPFVINVRTALSVQDTAAFNLTLTGTGDLDSPWLLTVAHDADTGGLQALPDVDVDGATDAQVLAYDLASSKWVPAAPTTASPGAVITSNGTDGDGSVGDPLVAVADPARYLQVTGAGIGLNNAGINGMVRVFADAAARDAASPAPQEGTVGLLMSEPSHLWQYDGADWVPIYGGVGRDVEGELLATSGAYAGGPITKFIRQVSTTTDGSGAFVALSADDLADYSGVLSVVIVPTGTGTAWSPMTVASGGIVSGRAKRLSDGTALTGASITCVVEATLY